MNTITLHEAQTIIEQTNGKIFSAVFTKVNGQDRYMLCRTGVKIGLSGKGLKYNPNHYGLITVWDIHKQGYRMLRLDTLKSIQSQGITYTVVNTEGFKLNVA